MSAWWLLLVPYLLFAVAMWRYRHREMPSVVDEEMAAMMELQSARVKEQQSSGMPVRVPR